MTQNQVIVSLPKSKETVLYEYTKTGAHITFRVSTVVNKLRREKIAHGVFELTRDKKWFATCVQVSDHYKRKGVGSVMYTLVQSEVDGMLVPSDEQSDEAKAFWEHRLDTKVK